MKHASRLSLLPALTAVTSLVHASVLEMLGMCHLPQPEEREQNDVRYTTFTSNCGQLVHRFDGIRIELEARYQGRPVLFCAIRDRQLDATRERSRLTRFPNTDPACNRLPSPDCQAAELSIYSWHPRTYLPGLKRRGTLGHFIAHPDNYIWKLFRQEEFYRLWEQAFFSGRGPWQQALPMPGVPRHFVQEACALLHKLGYHRVDAVPSWFNVAHFFGKLGFTFTFGEHRFAYEQMRLALREYFSQLSITQQSWLVALQNLPQALIPEELSLPARWAVTHTNMYWVRMHKHLNPVPADKRTTAFGERITSRLGVPG